MRVRLPAGEQRRTRAPAGRPRALLCPQCGSGQIASDLDFISGARYFCKECGFRGPLVIRGTPREPDKGADQEGVP